MKKLLLNGLAVAFFMTTNAQHVEKEYSLAEIRSSDDLEYETYSYNENHLLSATEILWDDGTMLRDSISYDTSNNLIRIDGYQLLNNQWKKVSYIDYTYDNDGNRTSRSNYNSFGGTTFTLGGVYNYMYENGQLSSWELLMGGTDIFEKGDLTYDGEGRLLEEIAQSYWGGAWENSWKISYEYNPDGSLDTSYQSFWFDGSWEAVGGEYFYYDDQGNCIKWETKNGNTVTNKNEYEYNLEHAIEQIVLPTTPEMQGEKSNLVQMNNMVTQHQWYTENDQGYLVYVCDYLYTYDYLGSMGTNAASMSTIQIFPNPSADIITISGGKNPVHTVDVLDSTGKSVLKLSNLNHRQATVDISGLASGVYFVRTATTKGISTQRVVRQ